ncbi:hypothetical protein [Rufibacter sp. LB8]|uniref:hypothetical protein n=1 Tax=Rufibacter sp. LB8 TaxID=2777781 RepID=UPI00178C81E6|nr:hypothetical protein [Rufibacter sp. LB8]
MTKEEWQTLNTRLVNIVSEFSEAYSMYKTGSNNTKRDRGLRDAEANIHLAIAYIKQHAEALELLTGGPNVHWQTRTFKFDEFKQLQWFGKDMPRFLEKIDEKISSFETPI